jgi:hypothetical protein
VGGVGGASCEVELEGVVSDGYMNGSGDGGRIRNEHFEGR